MLKPSNKMRSTGSIILALVILKLGAIYKIDIVKVEIRRL